MYGNYGCDGGAPDNSYEYIKDNDGIDTESSYPYTDIEKQECKFKQATVGAEDKGYTDLESGDEDVLKVAVATQGPISVGIDALHRSFKVMNW